MPLIPPLPKFGEEAKQALTLFERLVEAVEGVERELKGWRELAEARNERGR